MTAADPTPQIPRQIQHGALLPGSHQQIPNLQLLVLDRIDPTQNMQRYYVLSLEPTLFGDTGLRRHWGRIGSRGLGSSHLDLHENPKDAKEALQAWLERKMKRGYALRTIG